MQRDLPPLSTKFHLQPANSAWIWIFSLGKVGERDEDGKPLRFIGTCTAITALKPTEHGWRENEARCRLLFERSMDANSLSNREGQFLVVNAAAYRLFGYNQDERLKIKRSDIVDETSDPLQNQFKALYRDKKNRGAITLLGKRGEHFIGEDSSAVFQTHYGQFEHNLSICTRGIYQQRKAVHHSMRSNGALTVLEVKGNTVGFSLNAEQKFAVKSAENGCAYGAPSR